MKRERVVAIERIVALALGIPAMIFTAAVLFGAGTQPPLIRSLASSIREPSTFINVRVLAAGVAETVTVPSFAQEPGRPVHVIFSATCSNYWYSVTGTAATPAADVTDGGGSGRSPIALRFDQGDTFSLEATADCVISMECYLE